MRTTRLKNVGVRLEGFDIRERADVEAFVEAFRQYGFVVFNDPQLSDEDHLALMAALGEIVSDRPGGPIAFVDHNPADYPADAIGADPKNFDFGELLFHFDFAFDQDWPIHAISLFAETIPPEGGDTLFVHGGDAYARLSPSQRARLEGRKAVHVYDPVIVKGGVRTREADLGPHAERGRHEAIRAHPYRGTPVLTIAFSTTDRIEGLPAQESDALLDEVFELLYDPEHMLRHKWQVGDLVVWDNRVVQHSRENFEHCYRRKLRRVLTGSSEAWATRTMQRRSATSETEALP